MSQDQVQEIKQKVDIVSIIGERVKLTKSGRNLKGLCPFHAESTPSFFVTPEMQIYKCFGCGESGDVISFIQNYEGLTFPEALEQLADRVGVKLERVRRTPQDKEREAVEEVLHLTDEFYHYLLMEHDLGEPAREYLEERGLSQRVIKDFHLGYAPNSWDATLHFLHKKKGYSLEEIERAGLVIPRSSGGGYYDRFRGRVMFPLKTYSGKVVGFSGRVLNPEVKTAKYINSPETELYHKSELLYGLSLTKQYVRRKDRVVVVEGEMDAISSYQAGVKEVVAIKGSALTEEQVMLLRRLTKNIVLALDADEAGQEAIQRGAKIAEEKGMNLQVVQVSGGKDPDDVARGNPKKWQEMVEKAVSVYAFYIDLAFSRFDAESGPGRKQISEFLAPVLSRIENSVEQQYYLKQLAERLGVPIRIVEQEIEKAEILGDGQKTRERVGKVEEKQGVLSRRERLERKVVSLVLHSQRQVSEWLPKVKEEWFAEEYLQQLIKKLKEQEGDVVKERIAGLSNALQTMVEELYLEEMDVMEETPSGMEESYREALKSLEQTYMKERLVKLSQQMAKSEDEEEVTTLREEYRSLSKRLLD